jgi:DNA-binding transcriptional ArsR family regulator
MIGNGAFKALADPTRRRILELLNGQEMTAGDIAGHFPIAFPSVSRHLGILKGAELVASRREGQNVVYRLNTTVVQDIARYLIKGLGGDDDA